MGDVINLKAARKIRARTGKADAAAVNRAKFGRTKAARAADDAEAARREAMLDGARRE